MGASDIYMRFYVGDYLADTGDLSTAEHGAYFLLLLNMWRQGGWLDADQERLRRLARAEASAWPALWAGLAHFFTEEDGRVTQKRLLAEYERAVGLSEAQAKRGRSGGLARASRRLELVKPALSQISESESDRSNDPAPAHDPPATTHGDRSTWHANDWLLKFTKSWCERYRTPNYGQGSADAKATAELGSILRSLGDVERIAAQARASEMFAEYFDDATADRARHPWDWFVRRFQGLRMKPATRAGPQPADRNGRARDPARGYAAAPAEGTVYPEGTQTLE